MAKIIGYTDVTNTELAVLDGIASPGTVYASKALTVDANKDVATVRNLTSSGSILTSGSVGTAATGAVAEEHGDGFWHVTKLTCTALAVGTGGDNADLAIGGLVYTFPAGAIAIEGGSVKGIFDQTSHGTIADGEVGLGTVVGSTAVDTIAEVGATSGDVMLGRAISSYVLGTTVVTAAGAPVTAGGITAIASGASPRTVYLNLAATWPDIAAPEAVTFTGVVTIKWRIVS